MPPWTPHSTQYNEVSNDRNDMSCNGTRHDTTKAYMDVLWFVFHALQLLSIKFTQQDLFCISKFMMKHKQNLD